MLYQLQEDLFSIEVNWQDSWEKWVEEDGVVAYFKVLSQNTYEEKSGKCKHFILCNDQTAMQFTQRLKKYCKNRSFYCFRRFWLRSAEAWLQFVSQSEKPQEDACGRMKIINLISTQVTFFSASKSAQVTQKSHTIRNPANR
jgi:hypothetical protein